jgi:hypothetical protein
MMPSKRQIRSPQNHYPNNPTHRGRQAIENAITVFNLESDEIKGQIIGGKVVISAPLKRQQVLTL